MDSIEYIKQKYNELIPRSFKTKLDVFLFHRCITKRRIESVELSEFKWFKIEKEILELYNKAWQLEADDKLSEDNLTISEIDEKIEKWTKENKEFIKEIFNEYRILFITDYFPFSQFEELYPKNPEDRICTYCRITDKDIEMLDNNGKIYTKRTRGFSMEIDRIEPNKEYSPDNCVLACYWCNNAKSDEFTLDEFIDHIGPGIQSVWKERDS